jgi:hypothetical protein
MILIMKEKDIFVLLKIQAVGGRGPYQDLSRELGISVGAVHQSVRFGQQCGLLRDGGQEVVRHAFREWFLFGAKYCFPLKKSGMGRGLASGIGAPPFLEWFDSPAEGGWVWPDPEGQSRGEVLKPLVPSVPFAASRDPKLYEWLAVFDVIRGGRARERNLAAQWVDNELKTDDHRS